MINYYYVLGVSPQATAEEIKSAFKAKAVRFHPDKHDGDKQMEERFKQINEAYQVLSNPYKRSNHDMMLRYGQSATTHVRHPQPVYQSPRGRNYAPPMNNWKATAYAFLFAFSIALIMKTGMYLSDRYEARQRAEFLASRRLVFDDVMTAHDHGDFSRSLQLLSDLGYFSYEERDMRDFKDQLILDIKEKGDQLLKEQKYDEAIAHYSLLKDHAVSKTITYLKKIAVAYQGMGETGKALEIFQLIHLYGYRSTGFYYEIGLLYEEGMKDPERALNYYQIGADMASSEYEVTIGSAYPVVISASMVPEIHYDIYLKVARMHLKLNHYQEALDAVAWPKEIWTDSLLIYRIEAEAYRGLGQLSAMRRSLSEARKLDPSFELNP